MDKKITIYVATHKKFVLPPNIDTNIYLPILCGKAIYTPEEDINTSPEAILPTFGDDTEYNISSKNPYYCELTAMYWAWKNDQDSDVLGLNHYRRYFVQNDDEHSTILNKENILDILYTQGYDAILQGDDSNSGSTYDPNTSESVYKVYKEIHVGDDMDKALIIIKNLYPELYPTIEHELKENDQMCFCNLMIAKQEVFKAYCKFIFEVFSELEKQIDYINRDNYQQRAFGFLSERLMRPFFIAKKYKFADRLSDGFDLNCE